MQEANGHRYAWNAAGRLEEKVAPSGTAWRYRYDGAGHLVEARCGDARATYRYDALGRRIERASADGVTRWEWDGNQVLCEIAPRGTTRWIFHPAFPRPIARIVDGVLEAAICDDVGTLQALVDCASGEVVWSDDLDLNGLPLATADTAPPLRFPGQWADSSCGLYYNHHRYYDPHSGRYTSPDPIGLRGGIDPYAYVPDPTREADPTGLKKCTPKDILDEAYDYSRGACEQRARNMLNAIMNDLHPDDVNRAAIVRLDSTADAIAARTRNMPGGNNNRLLDLATGVWEREGGFHNVVVVDTDQGWFVLDPMVSRENWLPYGEYFGHTGYVDTAGARYVPGYFFDDSPLMPGGPPVEIEWETVPRDP